MASFRRIPVAELKPLLEQALVNILDTRRVEWDEKVKKTQTYANEKRQKSWLVRLGWKKYVPVTYDEMAERLKNNGDYVSDWDRIQWRYGETEDIFKDLLRLCNVAKQEEFVSVDSDHGSRLSKWLD